MNNWEYNNELGIFLKINDNSISYPSEGNNDSFDLENNSPWFIQRNDLINFYINKYRPNGDFLDIGAGNGFQAQSIINNDYPYKVICCEPGLSGCINAKKREIKYVYNGFFQDFPFEKFEIKAIGLFDVIEHIEDDIKFLNEIYEKVSVGTFIFVNVPAMMHLFSETDEFAGHFRRYNKKDIKRIVNNTYFKLVDHTYFFNFYYFPLLILRVIPYYFGFKKGFESIREKEKIYLREQKFSFIDSLSYFFHKVNLKKLTRNKKINWGTSLFIVLKK